MTSYLYTCILFSENQCTKETNQAFSSGLLCSSLSKYLLHKFYITW